MSLNVKYLTIGGKVSVIRVNQETAQQCLEEIEERYGKWGQQGVEGGHQVFEMAARINHDRNEQKKQVLKSGDAQDYVLDPQDELMFDKIQIN